jgi:hypothetical protein
MMSSVNLSMPQSVWWMTNHSAVPSSLGEMTSDRTASPLARPPALRITWASPSASLAKLAGFGRNMKGYWRRGFAVTRSRSRRASLP